MHVAMDITRLGDFLDFLGDRLGDRAGDRDRLGERAGAMPRFHVHAFCAPVIELVHTKPSLPDRDCPQHWFAEKGGESRAKYFADV